MAKKRNAIAMTDEEAAAFLEECSQPGHSLEVASTGASGYPHQVAMWYALMDGKIHFTSYAKAQKVLNLQRNPKISCMLEKGDTYGELRGLVIEGDAEIIDDPETVFQVLKASSANHAAGNPMHDSPDEQKRKVASKRVVIKVNPVNVFSWDHRKLGGTY